jgi:hypothetical protein
MIDFGKQVFLAIVILTSLCFGITSEVMAASYEILAVETLFNEPRDIVRLQPRAIVVNSSTQRFNSLPRNTRNALKDYFVYQTRVRIDGNIYYRLVAGNFETAADAQAVLELLKPTFPNGWIYSRSDEERQLLATQLENSAVQTGTTVEDDFNGTADSLLAKARGKFLDGNFAGVIAITDKIVLTGDLEQVQAALELAGTARERQGRFSQAVVLYESLLETSPPADVTARVTARLEGIRTMSIDPKARLPVAEDESSDQSWTYSGALHQYFRDDRVETDGSGVETAVQELTTDLDLQVKKQGDIDSWLIKIDASLIADLLEDQSENRVSEASIRYTTDDFRITGGRQYRSVTGVYGRFDGITYSDLSRPGYQLKYFFGNYVQSTFDGLDGDNPLLGANLDFNPNDWLTVNLFLINQEISGLTDRQAIGGEFEILNDSGFIYAIVDYDLFYEDLNNITVTSNYRYDSRWSFNLSLGHLNSPTLTTSSALQGQSVKTIDELEQIFDRDEIYRLAEDRSSKSNSLYLGTVYDLEDSRQLNLDIFYYELDGTRSSGGVDAIPSTSDLQLSVDYSVRNLFSVDDYSSMGFRLADSDTSEIVSFRLRSRFRGPEGLFYDPRVQLDFRSSKNGGVDQTILKPTFRLRYRATRNLNFEGDFGFEYSDLDLPDFDRQVAYSLFLGYAYYF